MNSHNPILLPLAFVCVLAQGIGPSAAAGAKQAATAAAPQPDECAMRYHASLGRIAADDLPLLRDGAAAGTANSSTEIVADQALPGVPLFMAPGRQRSRAEISALTAAVALARTRGRSTALAGGNAADRAWIAARLREDLGDYLNQKPTPYLCSGVPAYLETLRSFAARLGPAGDRRQEWIATQRGLAENSIRAAGDAIGKARLTIALPASGTDLRPAAGIARTDPPPPPPPARQPMELGTEAGLLAAIDHLVADAKAANIIDDLTVPATTDATAPAAPPPPRPVLAKLAEAKPLVTSARPRIRDRTARLKLLAAFSDLEMLDYLMKAPAEMPDPIASAIGKTLGDVEAAQKADCTCGGAAVRP
ncbi:hypothetical protein [Aureimonas leprariae]|uniref:Uncharacterized protein n=1 Tax=Plantimonas leprariae TaxID=2615207 RepID=A0A7V7PQG2_9HYPH|nr:hypothetical protein [Aureimonas leprariae]KAB0680407.1 hypothetical protein F6X38_09585 [Aureimonas leprariae]